MSESDSFIQEVSDEVRRDKLYATFRRWAPVAVIAVLLLVGGAAYNEWQIVQARNEAQANGDALLSALGTDDLDARAAALADIDPQGQAAAVAGLIRAAAQQEAGEIAAARETLDALAMNGDVPAIYNDLAAFKAATLAIGQDAAAGDDARTRLSNLAQPGAPFALLAQEQLALMDLAEGDTDAAIAQLSAIIETAGVTRGLRDRSQSLMSALGADVPEAAATSAEMSEVPTLTDDALTDDALTDDALTDAPTE